jgi:hypothetical protein
MDTDDQIDILEVEDEDLEVEAEIIWQTPPEKVHELPYLKKEKIPWTKGPPTIPEDHYTEFGKRLLKTVEDTLLSKWILDRAGLYAILSEHGYPRDLDTKGGRIQLVRNLAKNPLELKWAAAWLIYKREGGLLDQAEANEFEIEIEKNLPENFQKLQEIEDDKQYKFATGQISMKRRVIQISQDQGDLVKWIGMTNKQAQAITSTIKLINQKLIYLKQRIEPTQGAKSLEKKVPKSNMADNKTNSVEGRNTEWTDRWKEVYDTMEKKLEAVNTKLSSVDDKIKSLIAREQLQVKKNLARKFYQIRKKARRRKISLLQKNPSKFTANKIIPEVEEEEAQEEEEDRLNYSY